MPNDYDTDLDSRAEAILTSRLVRSIDHGLRTADDTARILILETGAAWLDFAGTPLPFAFDGDAIRAVLRDHYGADFPVYLLGHDGWEEDGDASEELYEASFQCEQNPPEGFQWVTSSDCGMSWLYDLRGISDADLETVGDYLETVQ